jgi:PAS domain S-box-containing protein
MSNLAELEALTSLKAPIWVFDTDNSRICWANTSAFAFWHAASIKELAQRDFSSDSAIVKDRLAVIAETISKQGRFTDTWTLYPKDNPEHVLLDFQHILLDRDRLGLLIEVTERRAAPLDDTTLRLLEATRATSSLITMMSLDGRVLMQNPAALKCYGPALPANSDMTDLKVRLRSGKEVRRVHASVAQNKPLHLETEVQTQHGLRVHSLSIERGRDPVTGQPTILLSEEDVSAISRLYRRQEQQATKLKHILAKSAERLQRTEERIERALQVAAIWDWDIATDKLYFSPNFMQLLEYEPEDFVEKLRSERFEGFVHPEDFDAYQPILASFLANPDKPISHEMRFVNKSGDILWIEIEGKCFCDEAGKPIRTAGLLSNITQRKQIEATLLASQKMEAIGQLTGGIAHDFNNLLTVILGNTQLLEELGTLDTDLTSEIINAVTRGADLTRHLLAFARKQSLSPVALNITELATKMRTTLLRILSETIAVKYEGQGDLWDVFADAAQTEAAILNIALNARDAMPNGGTITIRTENVTFPIDAAHVSDGLGPKGLALKGLAPGDYVRIDISDTGTGMDTDTIAKAFDPFFTTKDVGKGTGLGLSMVLGFSQQSGGNTQISSDLGLGTTISVYLPKTTDQNPKRDPIAQIAPLAGHGEHVHILEDNQNVSVTVSKMVMSLGYRVSTSGTVAEALVAERQNPDIDVFLVDVILPGGKRGVDFASEVLRIRPNAKLILVSGYPEAQLMRDITQTLDFNFLPKPFSRPQISKMLADTLRG